MASGAFFSFYLIDIPVAKEEEFLTDPRLLTPLILRVWAVFLFEKSIFAPQIRNLNYFSAILQVFLH